MKYVVLATITLMMATTVWHPLATSGIRERSSAILQADTSLTGDWYLQPALASDTATGRLPVLRFNIKAKTFAGFTGCNQMNGVFTLEGDMLHFDENIALTRMSCEGYNEKEFLINLLRVNRYSVKEGVLWLMIDQTPVSKWARKPGTNQAI